MIRDLLKIGVVVILLLGISDGIYAQTSMKNTKYLGVQYHRGSVFNTNRFINGLNSYQRRIKDFESYSLKLGWQTNGEKEWHHVYNFPSYGFGVYSARFKEPSDIGYPFALFGFFEAPLVAGRNVSLYYEWGLGLTYNWKPYNRDLNPWNYAIGSYQTAYIDLGLYLNIPLNKWFEVNVGYSASHFSNGSMKAPNIGLNLGAPYVELRYNLKPRVRPIRRMPPPCDPWQEVLFSFAVGSKQIIRSTQVTGLETPVIDANFATYTLSATWLRQVTHMFKLGVGIDGAYDESINVEVYRMKSGNMMIEKNSHWDKIALGTFGQIEMETGKVSLLGQVGYLVARKENVSYKPDLYQRVGIKYHFHDRMFLGLNLRTYDFSKVDYLEWNVGYRIKWRRK
ncbi:hypothetical protein EYV94_03550 [Puteibacter caeruleilacunae]|nr:hypothetical protein EYV94_03550 [Puteibacter caeruleilacunae]